MIVGDLLAQALVRGAEPGNVPGRIGRIRQIPRRQKPLPVKVLDSDTVTSRSLASISALS